MQEAAQRRISRQRGYSLENGIRAMRQPFHLLALVCAFAPTAAQETYTFEEKAAVGDRKIETERMDIRFDMRAMIGAEESPTLRFSMQREEQLTDRILRQNAQGHTTARNRVYH